MNQANQADRDAMDTFHHKSLIAIMGDHKPNLATAHKLLLEAFATHRIAAEQATEKRIANWLREAASQLGHEALADAIEQGKAPGHER